MGSDERKLLPLPGGCKAQQSPRIAGSSSMARYMM
ncbi:unnamed protein product [Rhodiola kirilowii]